MFSLLTIASALLASALPTASARKDPCDDIIIKELYRKPISSSSTFDAYAYAEAFGENTDSYTDLFLLQEQGNAFSAYLYATADSGVVYVWNEGYGATVDCDKVTSLVIQDIPIKHRICIQKRYKIEEKACTKATAHFVADGYAVGDDAVVVVTTDTVTNGEGSGSSQQVYASGSEGAGASTDQTNTFEDEDGNTSTASATSIVDAAGDSEVYTSSDTLATDGSALSSTQISASSKVGSKGKLLL